MQVNCDSEEAFALDCDDDESYDSSSEFSEDFYIPKTPFRSMDDATI